MLLNLLAKIIATFRPLGLLQAMRTNLLMLSMSTNFYQLCHRLLYMEYCSTPCLGILY